MKNILVLFPIVFAKKYASWEAWRQTLWAFAAFCLAASLIYVINDIRDRERDRQHPVKKYRPLAMGRVSVAWAVWLALGILCALVVMARLTLNLPCQIVVAGYILLNLAYTLALKQRILVDVMVIALGFVLRAVGGALAEEVPVSQWLFIWTFTICLFMGFCKRYNELAVLGDAQRAQRHRKTLTHYTPELLTHLITLSAAIAIVTFLLYSYSDRTVEYLGTNYLMYTLPVVMYGVFRFAMLSMAGRYSGPTQLILRDRPFQAAVVLWVALAWGIIQCGPCMKNWLQETY